MEYGSIFGHGAYLGPELTADYLRRAATSVADAHAAGSTPEQRRVRTALEFKTNRSLTRRPIYAGFYARAGRRVRRAHNLLGKFFSEPSTRFGLRPKAISDPAEIKQLTGSFAWSAWAAAALRPGHHYSYTNNWPPEPLVDNSVTADTIVWSMLSLAMLLGGIGVSFFAFGRWNFLGWHGRENADDHVPAPGEVALTPGAGRDCLVLSGDGAAVPDPGAGGWRIPALPCRHHELLRHRPRAHSAVQHRADLALAACDFLGFYLFLAAGIFLAR